MINFLCTHSATKRVREGKARQAHGRAHTTTNSTIFKKKTISYTQDTTQCSCGYYQHKELEVLFRNAYSNVRRPCWYGLHGNDEIKSQNKLLNSNKFFKISLFVLIINIIYARIGRFIRIFLCKYFETINSVHLFDDHIHKG